MKTPDNEQTVVPENVRTYVQLQTRLRRFETLVKEMIDEDSWPLGVLADMGLIDQALKGDKPQTQSSAVATLLRYYYKALAHEQKSSEDIDLPTLASHIIRYYADFRSAMYVEVSQDYLTAKEIAAQSRYAVEHIRELIRNGDIEGVQTPSGWHGSMQSLQAYQERPNRPSLNSGPRKGAGKKRT